MKFRRIKTIGTIMFSVTSASLPMISACDSKITVTSSPAPSTQTGSSTGTGSGSGSGSNTGSGSTSTQNNAQTPTNPQQSVTTVPYISFANPIVATKGLTMSPVAPTSSGGTVTSCVPTPSLPVGVSLASNCTISGTPTALSPTTQYVLTASNSAGFTTASVSITVNSPPPSNLAYTSASITGIKGSQITPDAPTSQGGPVTSYSLSPSLPAGFVFNSSTGIVSGTPTTVSPSQTYTITATNSGGSTTTTLTITVNDVAPYNLNYPNVQVTGYSFGVPLTIVPTSSRGQITSCSITPTLFAGLSISSDCTISGTPTSSGTTIYTVTGSNSGGQTSAVLSLTVGSPIIQTSSSSDHSCSLLYNGTVQCSGNNNYGQLGTSNVASSSIPITVPGISSAVKVGVGLYISCSLNGSGEVWCWGFNSAEPNGIQVPKMVAYGMTSLAVSSVQSQGSNQDEGCAGTSCFYYNGTFSNVFYTVRGVTLGAAFVSNYGLCFTPSLPGSYLYCPLWQSFPNQGIDAVGLFASLPRVSTVISGNTYNYSSLQFINSTITNVLVQGTSNQLCLLGTAQSGSSNFNVTNCYQGNGVWQASATEI